MILPFERKKNHHFLKQEMSIILESSTADAYGGYLGFDVWRTCFGVVKGVGGVNVIENLFDKLSCG